MLTPFASPQVFLLGLESPRIPPKHIHATIVIREEPTIQRRKTKDGKIRYRVMVRINGYTTKTATSPKKSEESRWSQNQGSETRKNYLYACKNEAPFSNLIIRYQNTILRDNEDRNNW